MSDLVNLLGTNRPMPTQKPKISAYDKYMSSEVQPLPYTAQDVQRSELGGIIGSGLGTGLGEGISEAVTAKLQKIQEGRQIEKEMDLFKHLFKTEEERKNFVAFYKNNKAMGEKMLISLQKDYKEGQELASVEKLKREYLDRTQPSAPPPTDAVDGATPTEDIPALEGTPLKARPEELPKEKDYSQDPVVKAYTEQILSTKDSKLIGKLEVAQEKHKSLLKEKDIEHGFKEEELELKRAKIFGDLNKPVSDYVAGVIETAKKSREKADIILPLFKDLVLHPENMDSSVSAAIKDLVGGALGLKEPQKNILLSSNTQLLKTLAKSLMGGMSKITGGRVSNIEFETILGTFPSIYNTTAGNLMIIDVFDMIAEADTMEEDAMYELQKKFGKKLNEMNLLEFKGEMNKILEPKYKAINKRTATLVSDAEDLAYLVNNKDNIGAINKAFSPKDIKAAGKEPGDAFKLNSDVTYLVDDNYRLIRYNEKTARALKMGQKINKAEV